MRDRETDSWWSIMNSTAIGGELNGVDLIELPAGEKTTWRRWRQLHPDTLVLSVEGEEHVDQNPYDNYFASGDTFRGLEIDDLRLQPKAGIYSFWLDGEPYAVAHAAYEGGRLLELKGLAGKRLLVYRTPGAAIFESTRAWLVTEELAAAHPGPQELLEMAESGDVEGLEKLPGFDTFWYSWVAVNDDTRLIR
jgi:hypothetical protein